MRRVTDAAILVILTAIAPAYAQINNGDGTVISVKAGAPVRVVTAKLWSCEAPEARVRPSGRIGQFVAERFDDSDRQDQTLTDFAIKTVPRIGGRPALTYEAHPVSGSASGFHRFTFIWQGYVLKLSLATRGPMAGTFSLASNGKFVATGPCTYQSQAFRPPA